MKEQIYPNLYFAIIVVILAFLFAIYFIWFYKKNTSFADSYLYARIFIYGMITVFFLYLFMTETMVIYFMSGNTGNNESWIFTLLNSFLFGMTLNIISVGTRYMSDWLKYVLLIMLVYMLVSGLGYFGIMLEFRKPFSNYLFYRYIQTNSTHAIYFIMYNIMLIGAIILISVIIENEIEG